VLVADDNASARAVLANMLRSLSCRVTAVNSGDEAIVEALRAAREGEPYRLALLDWKMPGIDGATAAERLMRGGELKSKLPIILVTAYEREYASQRGREIGIDAVLHKPISPSVLHDAVLDVLAPVDRKHRAPDRPAPMKFSGGKRVLVVEDNEINRQVARELLTLAGIEVTEAHNGYQAIEKLASESFDAVLMDVQMPELDGIETVKAIRSAHGRFTKLPVIAMTAHAMLGDRERFLEAGMSDYIAKPIEEEQLLGVLSRWISIEPTIAVPAPPPAPQTEILPGLMAGDGVRRASGNLSLYKRLLAEFRRELDDMVPRLGALIEANVTAEGTDLLHTLKGSASTLGARRVAEIAAALESKLRKGESITIDELAEAAEEVRHSIERYLGERPGVPNVVAGGLARIEGDERARTPATTSGTAAFEIARRLDEHLKENNLAAVAAFEELKSAAGARFVEPMAKIEASLDRLDFDAARSVLKTIEAELGT